MEPQDSTEGWSISMDPVDHPITQLSFDAIIGCEGTKYCLKGFDRKEFRGKLVLAITANFVNRNTQLWRRSVEWLSSSTKTSSKT